MTKSRDFSKIYQRKIFCVNDVSKMIDVSIATVYSEVYFDYFLSFLSFVCKKKRVMYFCVHILIRYVENRFIYFSMSSLSAV